MSGEIAHIAGERMGKPSLDWFTLTLFWEGVEEVCSISEPLVKVLRLVDNDKPAMGYLYEVVDVMNIK